VRQSKIGYGKTEGVVPTVSPIYSRREIQLMISEVSSSVDHPNFDVPEGHATLLGQLYNINDMVLAKKRNFYLVIRSFVVRAMPAQVCDHDVRLAGWGSTKKS
jgi:hypothetical protein